MERKLKLAWGLAAVCIALLLVFAILNSLTALVLAYICLVGGYLLEYDYNAEQQSRARRERARKRCQVQLEREYQKIYENVADERIAEWFSEKYGKVS